MLSLGLPGGSEVKASACACPQCRRPGLENWVRFPGREDLLEKEMATHSSILAWKIPWTEEPVGYSPRGRKESDMTERLHFTSLYLSSNSEAGVKIPGVTFHER